MEFGPLSQKTKPEEYLWDVQVYISGKLVSVITVRAATAPQASTEAFKSVNVKVMKNYG